VSAALPHQSSHTPARPYRVEIGNLPSGSDRLPATGRPPSGRRADRPCRPGQLQHTLPVPVGCEGFGWNAQSPDGTIQARLGGADDRSDGKQLQGLVGEPTVYAALAAIDQALEQAMAARTESRRRRELAQLRGLLLILPSRGLGLEAALRHLIETLQVPVLDR
jgi:hypothetical protein